MTTALTVLPSPTPQLTQSLSPEECAEHRTRLAFEVEIVLQGYWQAQLDPKMKASVLADWADELEDWEVEQVRWGLRKWRSEKPDRKPNPGHIAAILKAERGKSFAAKMKQRPESEREGRVSSEAASEILEKAGFAPKRW